ncbi:MAG TPA: IS701 family transposase [Planctomycetota bacterium]|nr:IS701 family transposase [Planctomycetota bacterium]
MDVRDLKHLRKELDEYMLRYADCIKTAPSRWHMRTYVNGQIGKLERKSIEPIALDAGVPVRTLQEFIDLHCWKEDAVGNRVQHLVRDRHGDESAIAPIDETSFHKQGKKTVGVKRQYCGATGKIDNCVVSVHLGYVTGNFHTLIGTDLYLPEEWLADEDRRREAGIPDTVRFRTKPQIAVDLIRGALGNGMRFKYVPADEEYGRSGQFRRDVAEMGLIYVVEVPTSMRGWLRCPPLMKQRVRTVLAPGAPASRSVEEIGKGKGRPEQAFHVKDTGKGAVVWRAKAMRFFPWEDEFPGEECWLIIARNPLDDEMKYFLSNAPKDAPIETLLHVAFSRPAIERLFEESKGEVGMDHFEVRKHIAVKRHLILSMVSMLFLAEQTQRLRKKKSGLDDLPGPPSRRRATGPPHHQRRANSPA